MKQYLISYRITVLYTDSRKAVTRFGETVVTCEDAVDPVAQFEMGFADNAQSDAGYHSLLDVLNVEEVELSASEFA